MRKRLFTVKAAILWSGLHAKGQVESNIAKVDSVPVTFSSNATVT